MSDKVIIYSGQHGAYWGPNTCGYVYSPLEAGLYTREEAEGRVNGCGPEKKVEIRPTPDDHPEIFKARIADLEADLAAAKEREEWLSVALGPSRTHITLALLRSKNMIEEHVRKISNKTLDADEKEVSGE
jgi:hypothetical protein